jgi:acetyl-CoA carboxylase carboxyltransferase component
MRSVNQVLVDLEVASAGPLVPPPGGAALVPVAEGRAGSVEAGLVDLHGHTVGWFRLAGGDAHGALGPVEGATIVTLLRRAVDAGVPIVGVLDTSGADVRHGIDSLHAWGGIARAMTQASGVVPVCLVVIGTCLSGPALLLGLADVVVVTDDAVAYVSGPAAVERMTGRRVTGDDLGGAAVHAARSGVAHLVAPDEEEALALVADVLSFLPPNVAEVPPVQPCRDPADRPCARASAVVPSGPNQPYDVRELLLDIVDDGDLLELRPGHAAAIVTALARIDGRPVGVVANQPLHLAGTLKAAGFVRWCDSFGVPLVTFVDTPGFLPGVEQEWRGMIRHGAELAFAYALATVPRLCVVLRKAYGGAYIVMDAKGIGNDLCVTWPGAELAVMGPSGAVAILNRRELAADPTVGPALEAAYAEAYCTPRVALERGYVDRLIEPHETRAVLARGLRALAAKRERLPERKHDNTPL